MDLGLETLNTKITVTPFKRGVVVVVGGEERQRSCFLWNSELFFPLKATLSFQLLLTE